MKESVAAAWISQLLEALMEIAQGVGLKRTGPGDRRLVVGKRLGQPCLAQEGAAPGMKPIQRSRALRCKAATPKAIKATYWPSSSAT